MSVHLTVVGSINLDLVAKTERLPRAGETVPDATFSRWRSALFAFLYRNSVKTVDRFNLPPDNVVEIARQIEI